jgi:DNA-binding response OmpR family regulator
MNPIAMCAPSSLIQARPQGVIVVCCVDADVRPVLEHAVLEAGCRVQNVGRLERATELDASCLGAILDGDVDHESLAVCAELHREKRLGWTIFIPSRPVPEALLAEAAQLGPVLSSLDARSLVVAVQSLQWAYARAWLKPLAVPAVTTGLRIDEGTRRVFVDGIECFLSSRQFDLLLELSRHEGRIVDNETLERNVFLAKVSATSVRQQIFKLRNALGPAGQGIHTVRGKGYYLDMDGADVEVTKE